MHSSFRPREVQGPVKCYIYNIQCLFFSDLQKVLSTMRIREIGLGFVKFPPFYGLNHSHTCKVAFTMPTLLLKKEKEICLYGLEMDAYCILLVGISFAMIEKQC